MKLADIYHNRIIETLDKPLPYTQISPTKFSIQLDDSNKLDIVFVVSTIVGFKCVGMLLINPNAANKTKTTNYFNGPGAIRVFSTIIELLSKIQFDLLMFVPDDTEVDVEETKMRLYMTIAKKVERMGKIVNLGFVKIPEYDKPIIVGGHGGKASSLTDKQLELIVKEFGIRKVTGRL